jgi:hypothetical protein
MIGPFALILSAAGNVSAWVINSFTVSLRLDWRANLPRAALRLRGLRSFVTQ